MTQVTIPPSVHEFYKRKRLIEANGNRCPSCREPATVSCGRVLSIQCSCDQSMKRLRTRTRLFDESLREVQTAWLAAVDSYVGNTIANQHGYSMTADKPRVMEAKRAYEAVREAHQKKLEEVMAESTGDSASFYRQHVMLDVVEEASSYPMEVFE